MKHPFSSFFAFVIFVLIISACEENKSHLADVKDAVQDSLRADSIARSKEITLLGEWHISSYAGNPLDTGVMQMNFKENNLIQIITPANSHEGSYELKDNEKIISVVADKKPEEWLIKSYTPKQMILEAKDKEEKIDIVLKRIVQTN